MEILKSILSAIQNSEHKLKIVGVVVFVLAATVVWTGGRGIMRILHNQNTNPWSASTGTPGTGNSALTPGSDNQSLQRDLSNLQGQLTRSGTNIAGTKAIMNGQSN